MTNIQQDMYDLHKEIIGHNYYYDLYTQCVYRCNMTIFGIINEEYSDTQIINLCNAFWLALPDNATIRRRPLFALCDLAEKCFDEGEECYENS